MADKRYTWKHKSTIRWNYHSIRNLRNTTWKYTDTHPTMLGEKPTAGQTTWNMIYIPDRLMVFLNGVKLISGTDYTASNGTTIVLTSGADVADRIEFLCFDLGSADI